MPFACFSYPADVPPDSSREAVQHSGWLGCFTYAAEPRRMSTGSCFSYSADAPQSAPPGPRRMTYTTCFRY
jgi:hypothetical protein